MQTEQSRTHVSSPIGRLPHGWQLVRLKDVVEKVKSGATPKGGEGTYLPERKKFALIRSQNVFDRRFDVTGLAFISDEQAAELAGAEVQARDVLLNITGDGITFARSALVPEDILPACVNQHVMLIRTLHDRCDPGYLLTYLTHPRIKDYVESFNAGGSRRAITKGHIESFEVPLPLLSEQRAIAHVLGTLDNKIELNRRMNETVEAMARAIFKSWFVDFDPVRAKAEGRKPFGLDPATTALFPDSFQASPLGKIPRGWSVGKVSELASLSRDGITPTDFPSEVFDHYSVPAFDEGRLPKAEVSESIKSNKFFVPDSTVLLSKLNPRIPRVWLPTVGQDRRSICSTEFFVTIPSSASHREFVYGLFSSQPFLEVFATMVTGTSGSHQRVQPESLLEMDTIMPPTKLKDAFADIARLLLSKVAHNLEQSRTLAAIRDTLLPKLISGELRVKDAERVIAGDSA